MRLPRIGTFDSPVYVTPPPGDRAAPVRRRAGRPHDGRARRAQARARRSSTSARRSSAGGEQGLLSLAFAPDYAHSGRFYVYYTDRDGDQRVVEYRRRDADRADAGSARLVLRMADSESNHNGGLLLFGPDGLLYIGIGDGGGGGDQHGARGNAQNLGTLLGKILRIDPRAAGGRPYRVPRDNPFVGRAGARGEIYSYGLRNPWRFSFDRRPATSRSATSGRTPSRRSTSCAAAAGAGRTSAGARSRAARATRRASRRPGHVRPVIEHSHDDGCCSITGGYVVRDPRAAALRGPLRLRRLLQGADRVGAARGAARARRAADRRCEVASLSSFGEDARGRVYAFARRARSTGSPRGEPAIERRCSSGRRTRARSR